MTARPLPPPLTTSVTSLLATRFASLRPATAHAEARSGVTTALLYLLAFLYPIHRTIGNVNVSLGDPIVGCITLVVLVQFLTGRIPMPRFLPQLSALGLVVSATIFVNAMNPQPYFVFVDSVVEAAKLLAVVLWLFAIVWLLRGDVLGRFLKFGSTSVLVASAWSCLTVLQNIVLRVERPVGPFENPNIYGNYLVLNAALSFGVCALLREDPTGRFAGGSQLLHRFRLPFLFATQIPLLLGVLASGSRGSLLAYATVLIVTFPLWRPRRFTIGRVVMAAAATLLLVGSLTWFFDQHPYLVTRIQRTGAQDKNVEERLILWSAARDAFFEHPVVGIGYGQFRYYASFTHHVVAKVTHETYLSYAAETGLAGLLIWLWLIGDVIIASMRWRLAVGNGLSTMALAFVLASCVQAFFNNVDQFRSLWIIVGLVAAIGAARDSDLRRTAR